MQIIIGQLSIVIWCMQVPKYNWYNAKYNWTIVNCDLLYAGAKVQQPEGSVWRRHHGGDDLRQLCRVSHLHQNQ